MKTMLEVATSQIGYKENSKGYNKYNKAFYGKNSALAWCGVFVWWCAKKSGKLDLFKGLENFAYVPSYMTWAKKNKLYHTGTKGVSKGDLLLFEFDGDAGADHIGIYEETKNGQIVSIDGNTSSTSQGNGGTVNRRYRNKSYVKGYIRLGQKEYYTGPLPKKTVNKKTGGKRDVKKWQKFLCWYGKNVAIDGYFGPDTTAKTKTFQKNMGLLADGSVGPKTRERAKVYAK